MYCINHTLRHTFSNSRIFSGSSATRIFPLTDEYPCLLYSVTGLKYTSIVENGNKIKVADIGIEPVTFVLRIQNSNNLDMVVCTEVKRLEVNMFTSNRYGLIYFF